CRRPDLADEHLSHCLLWGQVPDELPAIAPGWADDRASLGNLLLEHGVVVGWHGRRGAPQERPEFGIVVVGRCLLAVRCPLFRAPDSPRASDRSLGVPIPSQALSLPSVAEA